MKWALRSITFVLARPLFILERWFGRERDTTVDAVCVSVYSKLDFSA